MKSRTFQVRNIDRGLPAVEITASTPARAAKALLELREGEPQPTERDEHALVEVSGGGLMRPQTFEVWVETETRYCARQTSRESIE